MADLTVKPEDLRTLAQAFRSAQSRVEQARNRFNGASQVGSAMGRSDLEQQYDDAFRSMVTALDQLVTSLGNATAHFDKVAGNYSTTDSNMAAQADGLAGR